MKCQTGIKTIVCALLLMGLVGTGFAADIDRMVLRVHVEEGDDTEVDISVPLFLVQTIYDALPREAKNEVEKTGITPALVLNELAALEGNDFINVSGKENVRIWIDNERERGSDALKFIRVEVQEKGDDQNVKICVPVGLVKLAGSILPHMIENGDLPTPEPKVIEELEKFLKQLKQK